MTISPARQPSPAPADRPVPGPGSGTGGRARWRPAPAAQGRPLWLLVPGGLLMTVVIVVPLAVAAYISLLDLDQYSLRQWVGAPFAGLGNYVEAIQRSSLLHSIWVSASAALVATGVALPIGVAAALTTQNRFPGRGLVRSIYLIPYVLPAFVLGTIWRIILQPTGVLNEGLAHLGIVGGLWLNGPRSYLALIVVQIWASWPLTYLLTLSGLQGIDGTLHEAAALDGTGWWSKLRYVVFPLLRGPVSLAGIISLLHIVNSFTLPFVLFGVPSPHDVEVLPVLTYVEAFQNFRFGLSAAMAVLSLVLILIPLLAYLRAVRLDVGEEGGNR
jgi:multiple sugar transport system permease protein